GPLRRRRWASIDVTDLTRVGAAVSLALTGAGTRRVVIASRESGRTAPRLVVEQPPAAAPPGIRPPPRPVEPPRPAPPPGEPGGVPGAPPAPSSATPCGVAATPPPAW